MTPSKQPLRYPGNDKKLMEIASNRHLFNKTLMATTGRGSNMGFFSGNGGGVKNFSNNSGLDMDKIMGSPGVHKLADSNLQSKNQTGSLFATVRKSLNLPGIKQNDNKGKPNVI